MSHITLIRHGQANSGAKDEASYDKLSPLGWEQAQWLGAHLKDTKNHHVRLYSGTLQRHIETAQGMDTGMTATRDARLNELEYFTLAKALEDEQGIPMPSEQSDFAQHLPRVFQAWHNGAIKNVPETFAQFEDRVLGAISDIAKGDGPALVVTSGGLISMVMRQHLDLDIKAMANVALAIMNTSIHRLYPVGGTWSPVMFNAVPHLEAPERHHAQTHV
jgi:broad specificity phosphatase PhoE